MAEQSRHAVQVRSAMTTVTPGVKAALICPAACSAVAALIWAGRVTMMGGAQVSWPGMSVPLLPGGRGAARRAARPAAGWPMSADVAGAAGGGAVGEPRAHGPAG